MLAKSKKDNLIRFRCRECNKKLKATPDIVGRKVKCTKCSNVEVVPPEDRLEKFVIQEKDDDLIQAESDDDFAFLLDVNPNAGTKSDAKAGSFKISTDGGDDDDDTSESLIDDSEQLATVSENFAGAIDVRATGSNSERDEIGDFDFSQSSTADREFVGESFARKKSRSNDQEFKRKLLGLGLALSMLGLLTAGIYFGVSYLSSGPKFEAAFEELGEVFHYREAKLKLEKSGRQMGVVGRAYVATQGGANGVLGEMQKLEKTISVLTKESLVLDQAYELYKQGDSGVAKNMISDATRQMDALRIEVELKMNGFLNNKKVSANNNGGDSKK